MGRFRPSKISDAQRRLMCLVIQNPPWSAASVRKATLEVLVQRGFVRVLPKAHAYATEYLEVTDAGKKYLERHSKAYGSGVKWSER